MKDREVKSAVVTPTEVSYSKGGTNVRVNVRGTDQETMDEAVQEYASVIGAEVVGKATGSSGRTFFDSKSWKSGWEPSGPSSRPWKAKEN